MSIDSIIGKVGKKIGSIKQGAWSKIEDVNLALGTTSQYQFVQAVAKDEGVDYNTALQYCTPHTELWIPKYSLGYKICEPYKQLLMRSDKGKQVIKQELLPEELELFESEIDKMNIRRMQKEAKKKAKAEGVGLELKEKKKRM